MKNSKSTLTIITISIITISVIWIGFYQFIEKSQHDQFHLESSEMVDKVEQRVLQYEQVLIGSKGLFAASNEVTLDEWNTYISSQNIKERFPGIQGTGFSKHVQDKQDLENIIKLMNQYGLEDYKIKPEGIRDEYFPVMFLYPEDIRNQKAIGYDIYSESNRKDAIRSSIETNSMSITDKIILVQEIDDDVQFGFLMVLPIYSNYDDEKLEGMVSTVFRIDDLMLGIFDKENFLKNEMKIYNAVETSEGLFFNSQKIILSSNDDAKFMHKEVLTIGNQDWLFVFKPNVLVFQDTDLFILFLIPIIGFGIFVLLLIIVREYKKGIIKEQALVIEKQNVKNERFVVIGELSARLAHDIRNPLSIIQVSLENLKMMFGTDNAKKGQFERVERSIDRINHQIDDVLGFVKEQPIKISKVKISQILAASMDSIIIPDTVKIILPKNDVELLCDLEQCSITMNNLILNGIQAMSGTGTGTMEISVEENDDVVVIQVKDSGEGISKENIDTIFDPLFTTKQHGTGLGLSSVKSIVEAHGGTISVTSPPTIFTITLPKNSDKV